MSAAVASDSTSVRRQALVIHSPELNYGQGSALVHEKAKRLAPDRVEPVVARGVRYEVLRGALARGFVQSRGVIAAVEVNTGKELWTLQVYAVPFDPSEELDAQEVFITEMTIDAAANALLLKNEKRQSFRINLADRSVAQDS